MKSPLPIQPMSIWAVNLYDCQWNEHERYQQQLRQVCQRLESEHHRSKISPDAKRNLFESRFDFVHTDDEAVRAWSAWVQNQVYQAAAHANQQYWQDGANISINIHESWCHITRDGGYHDTHTHPNSSWSGIYYLDIGDMDPASKNGVNRFLNPLASMYVDAGTMWNHMSTSIDINAESGMMILFPSFLQHSALVYHGKQDRYVLSFNCQITSS